MDSAADERDSTVHVLVAATPRHVGVHVSPGDALTRIPWGPGFSANDSVMALSAALLAAQLKTIGAGETRPYIDAMLMMDPPPAAAMLEKSS